MPRRTLAPMLTVLLAFAAMQPASAIPFFAHQFGVTCQKCHTVIPHLNEFGLHFLTSGERIRGVTPGPAFPVSTKINLVASSENQGDGPDGRGLPKAIVDEVEFLTAGTIGSRANYFIEQYAVDGGTVGSLREAWINDRLNPWSSRVPLYATAGSMTLPVPVDPETFRETYQGYTLFEQTVGDNPFNFFDAKLGAKLSIGDQLHGTNVQFVAGPGHDKQSGLETTGTDLMGYAQQVAGPLTLSAYRYEGTRPAQGGPLDRFSRTGFGLVFLDGKWSSESVLQTGWDSNTGGTGAASSGGFTQLRYAISPRFFTLARYEGTSDTLGTFSRDTVLLLGFGTTHNSRITLEDVIEHTPQTTNTMNLQYTVGY